MISVQTSFAFNAYPADVDGDGDVDVISPSYVDNLIFWYENTDGLGTFGPQQVISTSAFGPWTVHAADVDGDGDIDVLSASRDDDKIAWYENTDGLGTFGPQQVISANANGAVSVHATDVDGDGDIDVLSASIDDDKIAWYENTDGLGTFGPQQVISTNANGGYDVYAVDVDGDGDVDALSASLFDNKVAWYENTDGLGTFGTEQVISNNADGAYSVHATDLDGDGDVDVLSASNNDDKIAWYENADGLGTFSPPRLISINADSARSVYATDLDGDGDVDVLSASRADNKIAWYENINGIGIFGTQQVISNNAAGAQWVYAADIDSDGDLDVLSASELDKTIAWHANLQSQTLNIGAGCGTSIALTLTSTPPALGTTWTLTAYGPLSPSWLFFFGDSPVTPGIPIPGALPGCLAFTNGNLYAEVQSSFGFSASMQIPIPNFPGLLGYSCTIQAFSSAPGGFITSNGIAATVSY